MGLETEKADTRIFMDDDNFPRSGGPALSEAEKCAEDELDRDPHGMNSHLQVRTKPRPRGPARRELRRAAGRAGPGPAPGLGLGGRAGAFGGEDAGYPSVSPRPSSA